MIQKLIILTCISMASACAATKFTRAGYEEASHKVLKKEGSVELRHYSELQLVETTMSSDQDNGFMRLFRYIDGGNDKRQKIAMTTPVFTTRKNGESTMAFVLPDKFDKENVPLPNLDTVKNTTQPEMLLAAYRYSGRHRITPVKIDSKLREWIKENNLVAAGDPIEAFYDPPWTPGFLRRNELLIPVTEIKK